MATDIECQTDIFLDKPATPLFIPAKSGKDVETQIEEGEVCAWTGRSAHNLHTKKPQHSSNYTVGWLIVKSVLDIENTGRM